MLPAPFHNDLAQGPKGGSAYWLDTDDGTRIRLGVWPNGSRGTVIIFPGRTEYIEKYGRSASQFAELGFATAAVDWRGQGLADRALKDRKIGHVGSFSEFQIDVEAVMKALQVFRLPQPIYLVAHSMGGCIGLRALHNKIEVKKAVFSAPMWGITFTPPLRQVAWTLSTMMHPFPARNWLSPGSDADAYLLEGAFEENTLTTDRGMYNYMRSHVVALPDLALGGPSIQWLYEALREMRQLSKLKAPNYDVVTYLGTEEHIVDPRRIHSHMKNWGNGSLEIVDGARHEIMMEVPATQANFFNRIDTFFD